MKPYLSIIIPAHNEAERLPLTLIDMDKHLSRAPYSYEILVVDDGSTDKTAEIAGKLSRAIKNLKVVSFQENKGKGAAVRHGMLVAKGNLRLFTDADHSAPIEQIDELLSNFPLCEGGIDVLLGTRMHKSSKLDPAPPISRRLLEVFHTLFFAPPVLRGFQDVLCGFKIFRDKAAEQIFSRATISGWGFDAEVLTLALKLGFRIREAPISWAHDATKVMPTSAYLQILSDNLKIRWWLLRGKYEIARQ